MAAGGEGEDDGTPAHKPPRIKLIGELRAVASWGYPSESAKPSRMGGGAQQQSCMQHAQSHLQQESTVVQCQYDTLAWYALISSLAGNKSDVATLVGCVHLYDNMPSPSVHAMLQTLAWRSWSTHASPFAGLWALQVLPVLLCCCTAPAPANTQGLL